MVRHIMRMSGSRCSQGLEIWRQVAVTYASSAQTRVVTLLKLQADHDTHRVESRKSNKRPWTNSSASTKHSAQKGSVEHQDHVSTSKCSWTSCQVGKKGKGKGKSKKSKGQSKGKGSSQNQNQNKVEGTIKGKTKSKGKGQWTTWSGQSWSWNQDQGGKGKGKGQQVCSHCGRKVTQ